MRLPTLPKLRRPTAPAADVPAELPYPARRLRRTALILAVATVVAAAAGGYAWRQRNAADDRAAAAQSSVAQAGTAAQAIFSYDYRSFDAGVANGSRYTTGQFAGEYVTMTAGLKPLVTTEKSIVTAQVSAIGVEEVTGNTVTVLVYLNQYRRNAKITGEKVDQNRVVLTMRKADGAWKVAAAAAV
jgi:Mce-associated membrane protein